MRCPHGTQDWIVCAFCLAGIPAPQKPGCGTFDSPNVAAVDTENHQITLRAGDVVTVRGMPMRLLTDAVVESHMNNFRAAGLNPKQK